MLQAQETSDKRKTPRRPVEFVVLLKIGMMLQGRGHTRNVSLNGILMHSTNTFATLKPHKVKEMVGAIIKIALPSETLTLYGKIIRIDQRTGNVAIAIKETSDDDAWRRVCGLPAKT